MPEIEVIISICLVASVIALDLESKTPAQDTVADISHVNTENLERYFEKIVRDDGPQRSDGPGYAFRPLPFNIPWPGPIVPKPAVFPNWGIRPTKTVFVEVTQSVTKHPICWTSYGPKPACIPYFNYKLDDELQNFEPLKPSPVGPNPAGHTPLPVLEPNRFKQLSGLEPGMTSDLGLMGKSLPNIAASEEASFRDARYLQFGTPAIDPDAKLFVDQQPPVPLEADHESKLIGIFSGNIKEPVTRTISITKVETFVDHRVTATLVAKNCVPISTKIPFCKDAPTFDYVAPEPAKPPTPPASKPAPAPQPQLNVTKTVDPLPAVTDGSATTGFHPYVPKDPADEAWRGYVTDEFQTAQQEIYDSLPENLREESGKLKPLQQLMYHQEGFAEGSIHYLMQLAAQQAAFHAYLAHRFHEFAANKSQQHSANALAAQQAALQAAQHHAQAEQAAHQNVAHILDKYGNRHGLKDRLYEFWNWIKPAPLKPVIEYAHQDSYPDVVAAGSGVVHVPAAPQVHPAYQGQGPTLQLHAAVAPQFHAQVVNKEPSKTPEKNPNQHVVPSAGHDSGKPSVSSGTHTPEHPVEETGHHGQPAGAHTGSGHDAGSNTEHSSAHEQHEQHEHPEHHDQHEHQEHHGQHEHQEHDEHHGNHEHHEHDEHHENHEHHDQHEHQEHDEHHVNQEHHEHDEHHENHEHHEHDEHHDQHEHQEHDEHHVNQEHHEHDEHHENHEHHEDSAESHEQHINDEHSAHHGGAHGSESSHHGAAAHHSEHHAEPTGSHEHHEHSENHEETHDGHYEHHIKPLTSHSHSSHESNEHSHHHEHPEHPDEHHASHEHHEHSVNHVNPHDSHDEYPPHELPEHFEHHIKPAPTHEHLVHGSTGYFVHQEQPEHQEHSEHHAGHHPSLSSHHALAMLHYANLEHQGTPTPEHVENHPSHAEPSHYDSSVHHHSPLLNHLHSTGYLEHKPTEHDTKPSEGQVYEHHERPMTPEETAFFSSYHWEHPAAIPNHGKPNADHHPTDHSGHQDESHHTESHVKPVEESLEHHEEHHTESEHEEHVAHHGKPSDVHAEHADSLLQEHLTHPAEHSADHVHYPEHPHHSEEHELTESHPHEHDEDEGSLILYKPNPQKTSHGEKSDKSETAKLFQPAESA